MNHSIRIALAAGLSLTGAFAGATPQDNALLRDFIDGFGVAHNVAYPSSLLPAPFGIVPGAIAYSTNLGLKFIPPVLEPPPTVYRHPDGGGCSYTFRHPLEAEVDRQDYLGLLTQMPDDWGELGTPEVYHVNTDVRVTVELPDGTLLDQGMHTLPIGTNSLEWRAHTLVTPVLDFPPYFLLSAGGGKDSAHRAATQSASKQARRETLEFLAQILANVAQEGATVGADWLLLDGVPTPTAGNPDGGEIRNTQFQNFGIYDLVPPTLTTTEPETTVEATEVGGEFLRSHIERLRGTLSYSDNCDRPVNVNYTGPSFMPLGQPTTITWTATDLGPNLQGMSNQVQITQTITVQDTLAPILNAPSGLVVESADASVAVDPGRAAVFDLADVNVTVANDTPPSFVRDSRTLVTWSATDGSGNQSTKEQWITVKSPGTNTAPQAFSQSLDAISFEPITVELTGQDLDLLSGHHDQLSFAIADQPGNGFFVAPLFPYFIEDHRVENEFGLSAPDLNAHLRAICDEQFNATLPRDFVFDPRYITVDDDGVTYVSDNFYRCSGFDLTSRARISKFVPDADGELQFVAEYDTNGVKPDSLYIDPDGFLYYISPLGGSTIGDIVRMTPDLQIDQVIHPDVDTSPYDDIDDDPFSVAVDAQGILYLTDGRVLYAYDVHDVDASRKPRFLGPVAQAGTFAPGRTFKDLALDSEGNVYVSDYADHRVWKFTASVYRDGAFEAGELVGWAGRCESNLTPTLACDEERQASYGFSCSDALCGVAQASGDQPGQFNGPRGLAVDPGDVIYVTDSNNLRIQRLTSDGFFAGEAISECDGTCFVLGDFGSPIDVTVNSRFFYVLDTDKDLLHVFETTPIAAADDQTLEPLQTATVEYQSNNNFTGQDSFAFVVSDGLAESTPATVTIDVTRSFRPPESDERTVTTPEDTAVAVVLSGSDPDAWDVGGLSFALVDAPEHGALSGTPPDLTYSPDPDFFGEDRLTFTTSDGVYTSEPGTLTLVVEPVNDPPIVTIEGEGPFTAGLGYLFAIRANVEDADPDDEHHFMIEWSVDEEQHEGQILPDGTVTGPVIVNGSDGSAVITGAWEYLYEGVHTLKVCVSDTSGQAPPTCADAAGVGTAQVTAMHTSDLAVHIEDDLPTYSDELGIERSVEIEDGDSVVYTVRALNLRPLEYDGLTATAVELGINTDPHMQIDFVTPDRGSCTVDGTMIDCALGDLPVDEEAVVQIGVTSAGTLTEERLIPVVALATTTELDHAGAGAASRETMVMLNPLGDADGDGVPNGEDDFPNDPDETTDTDGDGTGDNADTDDDGDTLPDAWETRFGLDPLDGGDASGDLDADGLSDLDEFLTGSDPIRPDTDSDGVMDGFDSCVLDFDVNQYNGDANAEGDVCDPLSAARAIVIADINGDGNSDFAVLDSADDGVSVYVADGATGSELRALEALDAGRGVIDFIALSDADGAGNPGIAILHAAAESDARVTVVDPDGGTILAEHTVLEADWDPLALAALTGTGADTIAVLARHANGVSRVERYAADSGALHGGTDVFTPDWRPYDMADTRLAGLPGLAILGQHPDGRIAVTTLDEQGGAPAQIDYLADGGRAIGVASIVADDGSEGIAVAAVDAGGDPLIEIRGADDGALLGTTPVNAAAIVSLTSMQTTTAPALGVLAAEADGTLRVEQLNADATPAAVNIAALGPAFAPRALAAHGNALGTLGTDIDGRPTLELRHPADGILLGLFELEAPPSFDAGLGTLIAVGVEPVTDRLFVYPDRGDLLYVLSQLGQLQYSMSVPGGPTDSFDLDFATSNIEVGGTLVPAGTLLAFNGGTATLYALDPTSGVIRAQLALPIGALVGGAHVPGENAVVVVEWTGEDAILVVDTTDGTVIDSLVPGADFDIYYGDVDVDPLTGNLLLVSSSQNTLREQRLDGTVVADYDLGPLGILGMSGLAVDERSDRLWVSMTGGGVHRVRFTEIAPDGDADGMADRTDNCLAVVNADQRDTDGDGFGNLCDADLDGDCAVNFADLGLMKEAFFSNDPVIDLTGDGSVNFADLGIMKSLFFSEPGPSALADCSL